jgi:hypothetical protein
MTDAFELERDKLLQEVDNVYMLWYTHCFLLQYVLDATVCAFVLRTVLPIDRHNADTAMLEGMPSESLPTTIYTHLFRDLLWFVAPKPTCVSHCIEAYLKYLHSSSLMSFLCIQAYLHQFLSHKPVPIFLC